MEALHELAGVSDEKNMKLVLDMAKETITDQQEKEHLAEIEEALLAGNQKLAADLIQREFDACE